jgi:hypothetical protein
MEDLPVKSVRGLQFFFCTRYCISLKASRGFGDLVLSPLQKLLIGIARILPASIRVVDQPSERGRNDSLFLNIFDKRT